jgi:SSS family solute:Na+ symporter
MLSTSLSRDLYQAVLRPDATDAQLLRVGRVAAAAGGVVGLALAMVLPSVMTALKVFYGIMTAALFVPLLVGLFSSRPGARHARAAIVLSVVGTGVGLLVLGGTPAGLWLPSVLGMGLALGAFATAWLRSGA